MIKVKTHTGSVYTVDYENSTITKEGEEPEAVRHFLNPITVGAGIHMEMAEEHPMDPDSVLMMTTSKVVEILDGSK